MVRSRDDERAQRPEVRLDRIGRGGVGRGEVQFDLVAGRPVADRLSAVGGEVVQDDADRCSVRTRGTDRLGRGQSVHGGLLGAHDAPEGVVADGVAAVELPDSLQLVIDRRAPVRMFLSGPTGSQVRPDGQ